MKMDTLTHLKNVILHILLDIDNLCEKNKIKYYLAYGSALGAIRHKGFIPWDEDMDIIMDSENYEKFIECARKQLDSNKYYVQEGLVDWPMPFSKIKLKGTIYPEFDGYSQSSADGIYGIYVDVFRMEKVPDNKILSRWQYICGKYYLSYALSVRTYNSASLKKRILMWLSFPMKCRLIRDFIFRQVTKYNSKPNCTHYGCFYTRYKYKNSILPMELYGTPLKVPFEGEMVPIPEKWDEYLTYIYGDYMTPPSADKQVGLHLEGMNVNFGPY